MRWRSVGPARGGRSIAAEGSDARPNEYWFGATGGGAWKTTDGGTTWTPMTDGKITISSIGSVGICPSNPDVVYIGGGESRHPRQHHPWATASTRRPTAARRGHPVGLSDSQVIAQAARPSRPTATSSTRPCWATASAPNAERGVFKTDRRRQDVASARCSATTRPAPSSSSIDPKNPNVIFAALWESHRTPWGMSSGGPGSGLFKSTDGGDSWTEITKNPGLPTGLWGKVGVSVSGADSNRVYALIENEPDGGLYVSDDAGASWKKINDNRNIRQRAFYYTRIYADPKVKDTRLRSSTSTSTSPPTAARRSTNDPRAARRQPRHVDRAERLQPHDRGQRRRRQRQRQRRRRRGPTRTIRPRSSTTCSLTKHVPYQICGAQQDNCTACVSSQAGRLRARAAAVDLLRRRRRRERLHRARSARPRRVLRRQLRRPA